MLLSRQVKRSEPDLDLSPPVRLDMWAILVAAGIAVSTVAPPLAPVLLAAGIVVAIGALLRRDLVPVEWRLMAVLAPLFAAGGVTIALLHAATPDPLAELAALEPGEVVLVGRIASPPEKSGFGYMADLRVDINTADVEELDELPEVGPSTAESIIQYRQTNGQFSSVDELEEIPGIGPETLEKIAPFATV